MSAPNEDTYLARVIASSCRPDGSLDRERLCQALQVAPHDPVTIVAEAVLQIRKEIDEQKKNLQASEAAYATTLTGVFKQNADELQSILAKHAEHFEAAKEQVAILSEELSVARAEVKAKLAVEIDTLTSNSISIARNAEALRAEAAKAGYRIIVYAAAGFFAGAFGALLFAFLKLRQQAP